MQEKHYQGCACVIRKGNEILHESYAGWADIEQTTAVDRESVFRQASTTKLFTYAIMGMLYEEGKFLFADPVSEYLPEWRHTVRWQRRENGTIELVPLEHPISVRDAAAMMCGLPYCMFPDPNAADPTVKGMSEKMEQLLKNGTPTMREGGSADGEFRYILNRVHTGCTDLEVRSSGQLWKKSPESR